MNTLVCTSPGSFDYQQAEGPLLKKDHTIVRIRRIGVCGTDLHAFEGTQPFFDYPRILGHELAGEIVETDGADNFSVGEYVTFIPYFNCGECVACNSGKPNCCRTLKVFGVHIDGGMSEYVQVPSYALVHGDGLSFDALALVEMLSIGAHGVKRSGIVPGEFVLVTGAGPIGLGTMEFARIAGARVIALDVNEDRLAFCREKLGVEYTVNATGEQVRERLMEITDGQMPGVVIDATGNLGAIQAGFELMAHGGRYVLIGLQKSEILFSHPEFHKREATLMSSRNATRADFEHVIASMKTGKIDPTTYITHRVAFGQVKSEFKKWLDPAKKVIKAMISIE
jgi:2-desacetyl-2-hydroxyethyl bacteriochlorophyllide A dehydrogenase